MSNLHTFHMTLKTFSERIGSGRAERYKAKRVQILDVDSRCREVGALKPSRLGAEV